MSDNIDNNKSNPASDLEITTTKDTSVAVPRPLTEETPDVNLEDAFSKLFKSSVSGTGEEELLRIASNYSLQITAKQIKCLQYIEYRAKMFEALAKAETSALRKKYIFIAEHLHDFVKRWLELKEHNNSDVFVMRALDSISLRKFINENTLKVNIEK